MKIMSFFVVSGALVMSVALIGCANISGSGNILPVTPLANPIKIEYKPFDWKQYRIEMRDDGILDHSYTIKFRCDGVKMKKKSSEIMVISIVYIGDYVINGRTVQEYNGNKMDGGKSGSGFRVIMDEYGNFRDYAGKNPSTGEILNSDNSDNNKEYNVVNNIFGETLIIYKNIPTSSGGEIANTRPHKIDIPAGVLSPIGYHDVATYHPLMLQGEVTYHGIRALKLHGESTAVDLPNRTVLLHDSPNDINVIINPENGTLLYYKDIFTGGDNRIHEIEVTEE